MFAKPVAYASLIIATERVERRRDGKQAVVVFPTFCPFCGTRYDEVYSAQHRGMP